MDRPTPNPADADQHQQTASGWTARIENGETVYERPDLGFTTTDTEFVAQRTRANGVSETGGQT